MANEGITNPTRFGRNLAGATEEELFLKIWSGEILTAFERYSITNGRVRVRSITSGKSAQFPLVGAMSANYHTPGDNIIMDGGASATYLSEPKLGEKVIVIDGILQSSVMIQDIDDAMSHYDVRAPFSREMGWSLAKHYDLNNLWVIVTGSEASAHITGDKSSWGKGGKTVIKANFASNVTEIKDGIKEIAQTWDEADVPEHGRHFAMEPVSFYLLAADDDIDNMDYASLGGGTGGSTAKGGSMSSLNYAGMSVHKSNRITDLRSHSAGTPDETLGTDYRGTLTNVVGVGWQEDTAVGVVKLKEIGLQSEYQLPYLATLMVSGFACGHGVLNDASCAAIKTS